MQIPQPPKPIDRSKKLSPNGPNGPNITIRTKENSAAIQNPLDMIIDKLVVDIDRLGSAAGITSKMKQVTLIPGVTIDVCIPKLGLANKANSYELYQSLLHMCRSAYPTLIGHFAGNKRLMMGYVKSSTDPVEIRVSILLETAKRLLKAQEWSYDEPTNSWKAPIYMGDGLLFPEEEMKKDFTDWVILYMKKQNLLAPVSNK